MNDIEQEKQDLQHAVEVSRLMADMMQQHERENKRLWRAVVALCVALMVMAGCMVWAVRNAQNVANEAVLTALETVAEMEVVSETTTTINQDTGEGSGNNVYQAGEQATYNEAGTDEDAAESEAAD